MVSFVRLIVPLGTISWKRAAVSPVYLDQIQFLSVWPDCRWSLVLQQAHFKSSHLFMVRTSVVLQVLNVKTLKRQKSCALQ